jgi:hypothetical protein
MKLLASVLAITTLPLFAQAPAQKPPVQQPPAPRSPVSGSPQQPPAFTDVETKIVADINQQQQDLQKLIYSFMEEVKLVHPGYYFSNGRLEKIPDPPKPPEKPAPEKK